MGELNIADKLRKKGLRTTPQRLILLRKIQEMKGHVKAEDIYKEVKKEMPSISMSTVYRILKEFEDRGFVWTFPSATSYGLTIFDTNAEPHHHFVCRCCGGVYDLPKNAVEVRVKEISGTIDRVEVVLRGICESCEGSTRTRKKNDT